MKEFQFLVKEKCFTYIDVNAVTFNEEKKQLLAQGFVFDDDRITSDTLENAIIKYKKRSHDKMGLVANNLNG